MPCVVSQLLVSAGRPAGPRAARAGAAGVCDHSRGGPSFRPHCLHLWGPRRPVQVPALPWRPQKTGLPRAGSDTHRRAHRPDGQGGRRCLDDTNEPAPVRRGQEVREPSRTPSRSLPVLPLCPAVPRGGAMGREVAPGSRWGEAESRPVLPLGVTRWGLTGVRVDVGRGCRPSAGRGIPTETWSLHTCLGGRVRACACVRTSCVGVSVSTCDTREPPSVEEGTVISVGHEAHVAARSVLKTLFLQACLECTAHRECADGGREAGLVEGAGALRPCPLPAVCGRRGPGRGRRSRAAARRGPALLLCARPRRSRPFTGLHALEPGRAELGCGSRCRWRSGSSVSAAPFLPLPTAPCPCATLFPLPREAASGPLWHREQLLPCVPKPATPAEPP